ncbi:glycosyltransferase family 2 protein [Listeria booriae]|uniref:glycosyltransferase family 2 protein n=1 Tax=Listeria booriae TaxID=1552123 RepID=UPI002892EA21|nr:glycosyltransferase family 2 protein [Listeria booriae]
MNKKQWIDGLVSIIMPCYNAETHIQEAIDSVIRQTYQEWELIVIDDGSTDASHQIIFENRKRDKRILAIKSEGNEGAAMARNKGISIANGQYLAFLDSDDFWDVNKLQQQVSYMQKRQVGFTFTAYQSVDEAGNLKKIIKVPEQITYQGLLRNTIIGCLTVMLDRDIVGDVRMPKLKSRQDTATWLGILKQGHMAYGIQDVSAYYRVVSGSLSSNKWKMVRANWRMYREAMKLPAWYASYCMMGYMTNAVKKRIF